MNSPRILRRVGLRRAGLRSLATLTVAGLAALGLSVVSTSTAEAAGSCTKTETSVAALNADITTAGSTAITLCLGADVSESSGLNLSLTSTSTVTLDLTGHALTISNGGRNARAAISVPPGASLTIADTVGGGSANVTGTFGAAGIGGDRDTSGAITITGGVITAAGGFNSAGIGAGSSGQFGGSYGRTGPVTITGGSVTATGGTYGAGIGGGAYYSGGTVSISGGSVIATGGAAGAGIGGGYGGSGGAVTVSGGVVTATGGSEASAIGGGRYRTPPYGGGTLTLVGSGTPTTAGRGSSADPATVSVVSSPVGAVFSQTGSDGGPGTRATAEITFTVPPVFGAGSPPSGTYGTPYSYSFTASVPSNQPAATFSASSVPPGLTLSSAGVLSGTPTQAGSYAFTLLANSSGMSTLARFSIRIDQAALLVTASSQKVLYGTAPDAVTASYSGLVNGDVAPAVAPTCSTTATSTSPVGSYPATCSGGSDSNYTLAYTQGTVLVSPALAIVVASSGTSAYGAAPAPVTASYVGLVNGAVAPAVVPVCSTTATSSSKLGAYPTSCSGAADPNYSFVYSDGVDTVGPASLIVTGSSQVLTYGDDPAPVTPSYAGLAGGDTGPATVPTCTTSVTSATGVGTYTSTCSGAADANYKISYVPGKVVVVPAPVTVLVTSEISTYGTAPGPVSYTLVGLVNGDTDLATPAMCSTTATAASAVGVYPATCSGVADPNYSVSFTAGTVTVNPAPLVVVPASQSVSYGTAPATVGVSYSGLVNGDTAPATPPVCSTVATAASHPGTYAAVCSGAADPNYTISAALGSVTVTPAALEVVASSQSTTYGTAPVAVIASYSGLVNGDSAPATPPVCSTTATASSKVGVYPATCAGAADADYAISYTPGTVTVDRAALVVTASSGSSVYGATPGPVTASYAGLVNGDTAPATAPKCSTTATSKSKAGVYPTTCAGAADANYTISYTPGVYSIGAATLVVVASSQVVTYGSGLAPVTASYVGLVAGDSGPDTIPVCTTTASATSKVGTYVTSCSGAADSSYTITYAPGSVVVNPAPLNVVASSQQVVYGSAPGPVTAFYTGLVNGDTALTTPATKPVCVTTATARSKVGVYPTTCTGAADPNYVVTTTPGTVTVTPAPLTVIASSQTLVYGKTPVAVTAKYVGLRAGDTAPATAPVCSTIATSASSVGTYPSVCARAADADYIISYTSGTVTVTPAPLTVKASKVTVKATLKTGKITFVATVTNAATGAPAVGVSVVFAAKTIHHSTFGCTAVTNASGVATCEVPARDLLKLPCHPGLTATVSTGGNYLGATGSNKFTLS